MTADQLYDILAVTVGAPNDEGDFCRHVGQALESGGRLEYRFMGNLGFGGKLRINGRTAPYVDCYQEDETEGRKQLIALANEDLAALWAQEQKAVR